MVTRADGVLVAERGWPRLLLGDWTPVVRDPVDLVRLAYLATLDPHPTCVWDGSTDGVVPVRIPMKPGDAYAFARITELCSECRTTIENGDATALAARLTWFGEESERLDAASLLLRRYEGPVDAS